MSSNSQLPVARMFGFLALPVASIVVPLLAIPVLTKQLGADGWAMTAVSQSIGLFFGGTIGNWGWAVMGPARVAVNDEHHRLQLFRKSVEARLLTTFLALLLAASAAFFVLNHNVTAAAIAGSSALIGLLPTWYYIGIGRAFLIGLFDVLPKIAAVVAMVILMPSFPSGYTLAACQATASLLAILISTLYTGGVWRLKWSPSQFWELRANLPLVGSVLLGGGYTSLAGSLVALLKPSALPLFAAGYKIRDMGSAGLGAVTNSLRAWVSSSPISQGCDVDFSRSRRALVVLSSIGLIGGSAVIALLPSADSWLFSGKIDISYLSASLVGIALVLISLSMSLTFFFFAPAQLRAPIAISISVASVTGVLLIVALTPTWGAVGALLAIALGEATCLLVQMLFTKPLRNFGAPAADVARRISASIPDASANTSEHSTHGVRTENDDCTH